MNYYGIKTPGSRNDKPYIWWLGTTEHNAWGSFFDQNVHRLTLEEAIRAYEAIGYKCVKLKLEEVA